MKVSGIFAIVCLVALVFQRLVSSAPAKKATPQPTKSPIDIHCNLHDNIRRLINQLPMAAGNLEQKVYKRYQRLVSVDEKQYLHNHLHMHPTKLWSGSAQTGNSDLHLISSASLQSNTVVLVNSTLSNSSTVISCFYCTLEESKNEYKSLSSSTKVVSAVNHTLRELRDLLSEIIYVGKRIIPGSTYTTKCKTCQINLTKGKRNRNQIALNLAIALERLHAALNIMKTNFFALRKACPPALVAGSQSG
ncbi:uncharacterized protein LOC116296831 isoform X1 [Actinia tenebrosa]|uniref:Uncharacterized protein LOC116296831 isoform X1 n=1 Tax=Actinia tenebrosa TaxID=6105 RepID=A0A6P8HZS7_ACTTE|nr:uncharacterized protein LOC116296831 isoform X1 [Actinia tenebrosa]